MSISMRVSKLTSRATTKEIDGEKIVFWANYKGAFPKKPSASQVSGKKSKFRRFIQQELVKLRNGKLFTLLPLIWTKTSSNPLRFHVLVRIQEINPPPNNTTPPPSPTPKSPGQI